MISGASFLYMNRDFIELENILNDENAKNEKNKNDYLGLEILELNESETSCEKKTKPKQEALNKLNWSIIEEYIFFESHKILGNKWSSITKFLPDRSDNNLKNHFYSNLRKTLRRFIKEKFNYNDIKDKLKAFYSLIYIRDKMYELQSNGRTNDSNENSISSSTDENKSVDSKENNDIVNLNIFENIYIFNLLNKEKISLEKLDIYLNKLCKSVINDFILLKLNSDFLKRENSSIEIQSVDDRKEFDNLIKTFIFNQIINRSYSYLKNKKTDLSSDKYVKLIEFIRKYCLNKFNSNYDFESEIMNKKNIKTNVEFGNLQNQLNATDKVKNLENQIKELNVLANNNENLNIPKLLYLENIKNLNTLQQVSNTQPQILQNIQNINNFPNMTAQNVSAPKFSTLPGVPRKVDTISMMNNINSNYLIGNQNQLHDVMNLNNNNNFQNISNNYVNSLLGNKTLRSNTFVNNCEITSNNNNSAGAFNFIMEQNKIINDLLGLFNSFRCNMSNNVSCYYQF